MDKQIPLELSGILTREEIVRSGWKELTTFGEIIVYGRGNERIVYGAEMRKVFFCYPIGNREQDAR